MRTVCIIDDDPIHQRIAQILIEKYELYDRSIAFSEAEKALDFFLANGSNPDMLPSVILLDLNMPVMDGWDFLEAFTKFYEGMAKDIHVFIVTSSVDEKDRLRSQTFSCVKGFISKPLSQEIIRRTTQLS